MASSLVVRTCGLMVGLLWVVGCGGSDGASAPYGTGATGGVAGAGATGGSGGTSATGGVGGVGGTGGTAATGGTGGLAGSGGTGPAPTCTDGQKNGSETGVDCGGTCSPCPDGGGCSQGLDCQSGVCAQGVCQQPSCTDGVKNGAETDKDCGATCPPCADGGGCGQDSDCKSGVCAQGACVPATCTDKLKNGDESDVDCGGSCPGCLDGGGCNQGSDCSSGVCMNNICQVPTCTDLVKNGSETGVDCGGPACPKCDTGGGCTQHSDCTMDACVNGVCIVPCPKGTIQCDNKTQKICDGHGGFEQVVDCSLTGKVCVANLGCKTCFPGTGSCQGSVGTYCLDDGSGYGTETCDPLQGQTCDSTNGRCSGECAPLWIGKSYVGCDYYPTVTANLTNSAIFHFAVAVSNTSTTAATVTVHQGATQITSQTIQPDSVQVIQLPWVAALKGPSSLSAATPFPASIRVNQGAYRLRSTKPVTVYQFSPLEYQVGGSYSYTNDASLLLPVNVWGDQYRAVSRHHWYGESGFVAITASEDNTVVTTAAGPQSGQFKSGVTGIGTNGAGTVTLNRGDVVQLVSNGCASCYVDPNDPTGLLVSSTKPVQVIGGHQCIYIPASTGYCDHLEESMFPIKTLGKEHVIVAPRLPASTSPKVEMIRIIATQANTTLTYNPAQAGAPTSIAAAGGWVEIANNANSFVITSNNPVLVAQYMEGQDAGGGAGDPAMSLAVTPAQFRTLYKFHAPVNYTTNFANIIAPSSATVTLDGTAIAAAQFAAIGTSGYSGARIQLSNAGNGNHTITSTAPVGVSVYGYGQYTSFWYPGGLDLTELPQ